MTAYGFEISNEELQESLLKDDGSEETVNPRSVIKSALPTTLEAMHRYWQPFGERFAPDSEGDYIY